MHERNSWKLEVFFGSVFTDDSSCPELFYFTISQSVVFWMVMLCCLGSGYQCYFAVSIVTFTLQMKQACPSLNIGNHLLDCCDKPKLWAQIFTTIKTSHFVQLPYSLKNEEYIIIFHRLHWNVTLQHLPFDYTSVSSLTEPLYWYYGTLVLWIVQ